MLKMKTNEIKHGVASPETKNQVTSNAEIQENSFSTVCLNCKPPKIQKKLIPLKLAYFFWYGGAAIVNNFLPIYFKQLGFTVQQLSFIYIVAPPVQLMGPAISGFIADKIGRSKPVMYANFFLTLIFVNSILLIPNIDYSRCTESAIKINCSSVIIRRNNELKFNESELPTLTDPNIKFCDIWCQTQDLAVDRLDVNNISIFDSSTQVFNRKNELSLSDPRYKESENRDNSLNGTLEDSGFNSSWCKDHLLCNLKCSNESNDKCSTNNVDNLQFVFIMSLILIILYNCTFSNCYRFLDVIGMAMVENYDSDFGRERLWAALSIVLLSPLSGYVIKMTTTENGTENYALAIYFFDGTALLTMLTILKLNVQINPPGKDLWKKTLSLVKNLDVLAFSFVLLILGTSFCFTKFYSSLYLHQLDAPSTLLGVLPAINSLAGIPFVATSNWWVKRIGSNNLLVAGLLSYTLLCVGYSYLINPWYASIYEMLGIFSYHLGWVAAVRHSNEIAPEGLTAFTIATAGGLHYGIGKGTGSAVGLIMGRYGGATAYQFVASMCGITAVLYLAVNYCRNRSQSASQDNKPGFKA